MRRLSLLSKSELPPESAPHVPPPAVFAIRRALQKIGVVTAGIVVVLFLLEAVSRLAAVLYWHGYLYPLEAKLIAAYLEHHLHHAFSPPRFEVINAAVEEYRLFQELTLRERGEPWAAPRPPSHTSSPRSRTRNWIGLKEA